MIGTKYERWWRVKKRIKRIPIPSRKNAATRRDFLETRFFFLVKRRDEKKRRVLYVVDYILAH